MRATLYLLGPLMRVELRHCGGSSGVEKARSLVLARCANAVAADAPRDVLHGVRQVEGGAAGAAANIENWRKSGK